MSGVLDSLAEAADVGEVTAEGGIDEDAPSPDRPPEDRSAPDVAVDTMEDRVDAAACPRDPPSGPPAGTNQSCATGGAPPSHCGEAHFCGATYRAGALNAFYGSAFSPSMHARAPMRPCDLHDGVVRTGYIDAYEVTVARFRAWVRAGRPRPAFDAGFFNGHPWNFNADEPFGTPNSYDDVPGVMATREMCTYSEMGADPLEGRAFAHTRTAPPPPRRSVAHRP